MDNYSYVTHRYLVPVLTLRTGTNQHGCLPHPVFGQGTVELVSSTVLSDAEARAAVVAQAGDWHEAAQAAKQGKWVDAIVRPTTGPVRRLGDITSRWSTYVGPTGIYMDILRGCDNPQFWLDEGQDWYDWDSSGHQEAFKQFVCWRLLEDAVSAGDMVRARERLARLLAAYGETNAKWWDDRRLAEEATRVAAWNYWNNQAVTTTIEWLETAEEYADEGGLVSLHKGRKW